MNAKEENTFRALRDEELYVTHWGCRWDFINGLSMENRIKS